MPSALQRYSLAGTFYWKRCGYWDGEFSTPDGIGNALECTRTSLCRACCMDTTWRIRSCSDRRNASRRNTKRKGDVYSLCPHERCRRVDAMWGELTNAVCQSWSVGD